MSGHRYSCDSDEPDPYELNDPAFKPRELDKNDLRLWQGHTPDGSNPYAMDVVSRKAVMSKYEDGNVRDQ